MIGEKTYGAFVNILPITQSAKSWLWKYKVGAIIGGLIATSPIFITLFIKMGIQLPPNFRSLGLLIYLIPLIPFCPHILHHRCGMSSMVMGYSLTILIGMIIGILIQWIIRKLRGL